MNATEITELEILRDSLDPPYDRLIQKCLDLLAKQEGMVLVPIKELSKLEETRIALYELLEKHLDEKSFLGFVNITGPIWRVANTKKWATRSVAKAKEE